MIQLICIKIFKQIVSVTIEEAEKTPLKAYVLTGEGLSNQGVRIGPLDLSLVKVKNMQKYGLNDTLINRFKPYLGLVDAKAIELLKATPLEISQAEFDSISQQVKAYYEPKYSKAPEFIKNNPKVLKQDDYLIFSSIFF